MTSYVIPEENKHLVEEHVQLVPYVLGKCYGRFVAEDEDCVSIGNIGLCKAAATYNPKKNAKFITYASRCIANEYNGYLRYINRQARSNPIPDVSLNETVFDGEEKTQYINIMPCPHTNIEDEVINKVLCDAVLRYMPHHSEMLKGYGIIEYSKKVKINKSTMQGKLNRELDKARAILGVTAC